MPQYCPEQLTPHTLSSLAAPTTRIPSAMIRSPQRPAVQVEEQRHKQQQQQRRAAHPQQRRAAAPQAAHRSSRQSLRFRSTAARQLSRAAPPLLLLPVPVLS